MTIPSDIEALKVNKIETPKRRGGRLSILGQQALPGNDISELSVESDVQETLGPEALKAAVVEALQTIFDPEIPVNVYDLGLIYDIRIKGSEVDVDMTLTAPACPVAGMIVENVASTVGNLPSVSKAHVQLVWDPPWTKTRMSEDALLELGLL